MHDNVRNGLSKSPILTERLWQAFARAQAKHSPGKREITDSECLDIENELDDALEALSALKQRAIQIRAARAA